MSNEEYNQNLSEIMFESVFTKLKKSHKFNVNVHDKVQQERGQWAQAASAAYGDED